MIKILSRYMWCSECLSMRYFKKEKTAKGTPDIWYCRECGTEK